MSSDTDVDALKGGAHENGGGAHSSSSSSFSPLRIFSFITTPKFLFFTSLFASFMIMGMGMSLIGPALLELGEQTNSTIGELVWIFMGRSTGFFIGTLLGGYLVDKYVQYGKTILFVSLVVTMLTTMMTPWIGYVSILVFICLISGVAIGIIDNVAQVLLIRLMTDNDGKEVQPYMQALHAAFGVGAFISPLIISPFLGGETPFIDRTVAHDDPSLGGSPVVNGTDTSGTTVRTDAGSTTYHYAFYLVASFVLPVCVSMFYYAKRDETPMRIVRKVMNKLKGRVELDDDRDWATVNEDGQAGLYTDDQSDALPRHDHSESDSLELTSLSNPASKIHITPEMVDGVEDEEMSVSQKRKDEDAVLYRPDSPSRQGPASASESRRDSNVNLLGKRTQMHHIVVVPSTSAAETADRMLSSPIADVRADSPMTDIDLAGSPSATSSSTAAPSSSPSSSSSSASSPAAAPITRAQWRMVFLISVFLFLYVGTESGYGNYIFSYATKQSHLDPTHAAYLNSLFWFAFAVGRLIGIPISLHFSSTSMIFSDLLGAILSLLAIIIFHDSISILWIGTACYGLSVASIYPSAINYAERCFPVTGKILSILVTAASFGDAVIPLCMGLSFGTPAGPLGLMLLAMAVAVGAAAIFAVTAGCVAPLSTRDMTHGGSGGTSTNKSQQNGSHQNGSGKKKSGKRRKHGASSSPSSVPSLPSSSSTDNLTSSPHRSATAASNTKPNRSAYSVVHVDEENAETPNEEMSIEEALEVELRRPHTPGFVEAKQQHQSHQPNQHQQHSQTQSKFVYTNGHSASGPKPIQPLRSPIEVLHQHHEDLDEDIDLELEEL